MRSDEELTYLSSKNDRKDAHESGPRECVGGANDRVENNLKHCASVKHCLRGSVRAGRNPPKPPGPRCPA